MIRDHDWYNANAQRPWPFDDLASQKDDAGQDFPRDLIVDLTLRFPKSLGTCAFLSAFYHGPALISGVLVSNTGVLLATFRQTLPFITHQQFSLIPAQAGVWGQVVLGPGIEDALGVPRSHRFATIAQSKLLPQCARSYEIPPVTGVGKLGAPQLLQGVVELIGETDVTLTPETVSIDGQQKQAIVFRLQNKEETFRNLLELYTGPCGGRPESRNCGDPQPIEQINVVQPDCCGTIFVQFCGVAEIAAVQNDTEGIVVGSTIELDDACVTPKRLPDENGVLPGTPVDLCENPPSTTTGTTSPPALQFQGLLVATCQDDPLLPWSEDFDDSTQPDLTVFSGSFALITGGSSSGSTYGGKLDFIVPEPDNPLQVTVAFDGDHGLAAQDYIYISGNSNSAYNLLHRVVLIDSTNVAVTDVPYDTPDGSGGVWLRAEGSNRPAAGNGRVGTVDAIYNNGGTTLLFNEDHDLVVDDFIAIADTSAAAYNTKHKVTVVVSARIVRVDTVYSVDSQGGVYTLVKSGAGGEILQLTANPATNTVRINSGSVTGLVPGDKIVIAGSDVAEYNTLATVTGVVGNSLFDTDLTYTVPSTLGIWVLVGGPNVQGKVLESDAEARSITLFTGAAAQSENWDCWCKQIETIFTFHSESSGQRRNGGIVFNHPGNTVDPLSFGMAELSLDGGKELRLWQVVNGAYTLLRRAPTPNVVEGQAYRLQLTIRYDLENASHAMVEARLFGVEDNVNYLLGPVRFQNLTPAKGKIGLHAYRSRTWFESINIRSIT